MTTQNQTMDAGLTVDPLLWEAIAVMSPLESAPISFLQRTFKIGYGRAGVLLGQVRRIYLTVAFRGAWAEVVSLYWQGLINSEHTLQAHLLHALKTRLPGYWLICEPVLDIGKPDIVVCFGKKIEAFVEIKFPKAQSAKCMDDVKKLKEYISKSSYSQLRLDPGVGIYSDEVFEVSPACLAVFANIGDDSRVLRRDSLIERWGADRQDSFLVLAESIESEESVEKGAMASLKKRAWENKNK